MDNDKALTPQQRGAMITNSGKSPIASLPEDQRKALLDNVLDQVMQDRKLADIAAELGVARTSLNQALLKYCEEDWKSAQVARSLVAIEDCEDELDRAPDMLAVARARERLRSAMWQAEKLNRRLFGEHQASGGSAVQINIGINRDQVVEVKEVK